MSNTYENIYNIDSIQFTVFNSKDIYDFSSVYKDRDGINIPESYDNSEPKRNGVIDSRLGITVKDLNCAYCGQNEQNCPGHFGHTVLATPMFNMAYYSHIKSILDCICLKSSKLLANQYPEKLKLIHKIHKDSRSIFIEVKKLCSTIKVSQVGIPKPKIKENKQKKTGSVSIIVEYPIKNLPSENKSNETGIALKKTLSQILYPKDIFNILRNISDEDWELMGFNPTMYRPEQLLLTNFPVPPVAIRPSLRADFLASLTYEDCLTHKLVDIIKINEKLKVQLEKESKTGNKTKYSSDLESFLQYHIATFFDNDKVSFPKAEQKVGGKPFKSISQRIKSKGGRIRSNLMGKRVNFSSRTVITGDPNIRLDQLGVPIKIAMELTFPDIVTPYNIKKLEKYIDNGRYKYPGANYVIHKNKYGDKLEFDLRYRKKTIKLNYGDIVERHLLDDDFVLFNRQPSLHKLSMMVHRAHIINDNRFSTFRLNVNATPPYNADFDGDEMNMHVPQSVQTSIELGNIANIKYQIISPLNGKPIIAAVQDCVLGIYLMTNNLLDINYNDYMNLLSHGYDINKNNIDKTKKYTGKDIYSMILPSNINYESSKLVIKHGKLIKGHINKKNNKEIVYNIWNRNNPDITLNYIDNVQRLVINWLLIRGFTVGLGDCIIDKKLKTSIKHQIDKKKLEVSHLITEIENNPELLDNDTFELSLQSSLVADKSNHQKLIMNSLDNNNNFFVMINSGSKGNGTNITEIMGALGQNILKFSRIDKDLKNRTLPHYYQNDDRPLARGYIEHSYYEGLSPQEFFFHHMCGREGLIDTAIKTAETGYISRKLMKALEDIGVKYDGLVRTGNNIVIQYIYGDNNIDQTKQCKIKLHSLVLDNKELKKKYSFNSKELTSLKEVNASKLNDEYFNKLLSLRNQFRIIQRLYDLNYKVLINSFQLPVNIRTIIFDIINLKNNSKEKLTVKYIMDKITYILDPTITKYIYFSENYDKKDIKFKDEKVSKSLFEYMLYEYLSPKRVLFEYKINKFKFDLIVSEIIESFNKGIVNPGEMVGCLAAQHIGEPSTQMTLNSVEWNTELLFKIDNKLEKVKIGDYIDNHILKSTNIEKHNNDTTLSYINNDVKVLSVDEDGNVDWRKVEAVTQHPPINKDGSNTLLKIKTRNGQEVIATKAKSFLTLKDGKLVPTKGEDINIGDYLPVNKSKFNVNIISKLDLEDYFSKKEFIFGSQVNKALKFKNERHWWKNHNNIDFILPYSRSDIFLNAVLPCSERKRGVKQTFVDGIIYPKSSGKVKSLIPEFIDLDYDFGYLIGAYLAEGCITKTQISISNNSEEFLEPIKRLCNKFNITYKVYIHKNKNKENWTSTDIRIYSKLLTILLEKLCGKLSHNKKLDCLFLQSPRECIKGILTAYISGDGTISHRKDKAIYITSVSRTLLEDIQQLLLQFNSIYSTINKPKKILKNNLNSKNIHQHYVLRIANNNFKKIGYEINLIKTKQEKLSKCMEHTFRYENGKFDIIPEFEYNGEILKEVHRDKLKRDYNFRKFENIYFDQIVEIIELESEHKYVYDLTVEGTRNFNIYTGLCMRDTFHQTGSASVGMQGVQRCEELLRIAAINSTPIMNIYLKDEIKFDKEEVTIIASQINKIKFKSIINKYEIIYDIGEYIKIDNVRNPIHLKLKTNDDIKEKNMFILLKFELNKNELVTKNINIINIKTKFIKFIKNSFNDIKSLKRNIKDIINNIISLVLLSNNENDKTPMIHFRFLLDNINYKILIQLVDFILNNFVLKGVDNISKATTYKSQLITFNNKDKKYEENNEYIINTEGINMIDIRCNDNINLNRTYCNNIKIIYKLYGIEAARNILIKEFNNIYSGHNVSFHHISLLVDVMTNTGKLVSIDRHGLNKLNRGVLAKASFEMPITQLIKAAIFNEVDNIKNISSQIMVGKAITGGTGLPQIILDIDKIINSEYIENINYTNNSYIKLKGNNMINHILNKKIENIFLPV